MIKLDVPALCLLLFSGVRWCWNIAFSCRSPWDEAPGGDKWINHGAFVAALPPGSLPYFSASIHSPLRWSPFLSARLLRVCFQGSQLRQFVAELRDLAARRLTHPPVRWSWWYRNGGTNGWWWEWEDIKIGSKSITAQFPREKRIWICFLYFWKYFTKYLCYVLPHRWV